MQCKRGSICGLCRVRSLARIALVALVPFSGLAHALGRLFEFILARQCSGHLLLRRQCGHGGGGVDGNSARLDGGHQFGRCLFLNPFDHHHLAAAQARAAGQVLAAQTRLCDCGHACSLCASGVGRGGCVLAVLCHASVFAGSGMLRALTQNFALAQGQHTALKVGHAAPPQVLVNHPQVHIVHALELRALQGVEGNAMPLADAIAVVAVHQHIAPQHQGIAAALGQQAALQCGVFLRRQGIDIGFELGVDDDVHVWRCGQAKGVIVEATPLAPPLHHYQSW